MKRRKIIFFEANEIPFKIINDFITTNADSTLAKILPKSRQYTTVAKDKSELSPWITWPTVHRGVNDELHGIFDFGQDLTNIDKVYPPLWDILMQQGISVGVFGPLHSSPLPVEYEKYKFYIPDTFAKSPKCFPNKVETFQKFNLSMARKSAYNVSKSIDFKNLFNLIKNIFSLGIRAKTLFSIIFQLINERIYDWKKNRRRTFQPVLAFDIFLKLLNESKPEFVNFFTNHVASSMHRFWAAKYPKEYKNMGLDRDWITKYRYEIDFSMKWLDKMITDTIKFVKKNPEYILIVSSSMGQSATTAKKLESQLHLKKPDLFFDLLGVKNKDWENRPAMEPQYNVKINLKKINDLKNILDDFYINEKPISYNCNEDGFFSLDFGHTNIQSDKEFAIVKGEKILLDNLGIISTKPDIGIGNSAYHIPEGALIIYDPKLKKVDKSSDSKTQIDTREIAPVILKNFGIRIPSYMIQNPSLDF